MQRCAQIICGNALVSLTTPWRFMTSAMPMRILGASVDSPYSGADTVDIHTGSAHGARPIGVDPIVLGSQIVMGLQTVVSRTPLPMTGRDH